MKYLTLEQLLQLHVLVVDSSGGSLGLRDLGRLEAAIATQEQEVFGEILYKDIYEKAAALCREIIADHPFIDGNKRTAMLAGLTFLKVNSHEFLALKGELENFAVQIAVERLEIPVIAAWFKAHSQKK